LLGNAIILEFKKKPVSKYGKILLNLVSYGSIVTLQYLFGNLTLEACRETDETFVVGFQEFLVDTRCVVKTLGMGLAYHF